VITWARQKSIAGIAGDLRQLATNLWVS